MRIAVDAYFNNNLGDDLFLDILVNRYEGVNFDFMLCDEAACKAFINHPRVEYKSRKEVFRNIFSYDAYIFIGGSMFQEPENWKKDWRKFDLTVSIFKFFGKSTFVLGCNFGPYKTEDYKKKYVKTFKKLSHMTVRDNYSFAVLKDKGINLTVHPDIVLSRNNIKGDKKSSNVVGISIINWSKNNNELEYIDFNVNLIKDLLNEKQKVRLFAFQNTDEISDYELISKVMQKLDASYQREIEVISYDGNIQLFLEKYAECHAMVTSRFHSLILSLVYNQSVCPVVYSEKTVNTIKFLGLDLDYINLEDVSDFKVERVKKIFNKDEMSYQKDVISSLNTEAEKHFSLLDTLFRK